MQLALDDLASVRAFAAAFLAKQLPLHLLINNAGIGAASGLSKDGYELIIATNHLGHFLLTQLLTEKLKETAAQLKEGGPLSSVRIVNVASRAHQMISKQDLNFQDLRASKGSSIKYYGRSKLCNILHAAELARRVPEVKSYSLHPGVVATDIWRVFPGWLQKCLKWFMLGEEEGAFTTLYCALSGEVESLSGEYFDDCQVMKKGTRYRSALCDDEALAKELWDISEKAVASGAE